jgi:hypothetical protein
MAVTNKEMRQQLKWLRARLDSIDTKDAEYALDKIIETLDDLIHFVQMALPEDNSGDQE